MAFVKCGPQWCWDCRPGYLGDGHLTLYPERLYVCLLGFPGPTVPVNIYPQETCLHPFFSSASFHNQGRLTLAFKLTFLLWSTFLFLTIGTKCMSVTAGFQTWGFGFGFADCSAFLLLVQRDVYLVFELVKPFLFLFLWFTYHYYHFGVEVSTSKSELRTACWKPAVHFS